MSARRLRRPGCREPSRTRLAPFGLPSLAQQGQETIRASNSGMMAPALLNPHAVLIYRRIGPQPSGLKMRRVEGGFFVSFAAGRTGRGAKFPPQLGQTPPSIVSTQSRQNVHSNVQIIASAADGGRSLSQHSQLGRNSSIC
jgi:hypothetical protein